jgi:phosphoserine phosphatase RsbU/P
MKILIAEDDSTSRLILESALKKLGHEVLIAHDGAEALEIYMREEIPVLISDMVMPKVDGLELCRRIRAAKRSKYTYILLLTTVGGKSGYLVGMRAGADDFIHKPFDEQQLAARLVVAERILSLQSQVTQLTGMLPICACCKKVRDDKNYWQQVETYISQRTGAKFSHGYCPDCFKKAVAEIERANAPAPAVAA